MNINKIITLALIQLGFVSCDFSEDYCTRYVNLSLYPEYGQLPPEDLPQPADRQLIYFGEGDNNAASIGKETFISDTLNVRLQQGNYSFIYIAGEGKVIDSAERTKVYYEANTTRIDDQLYVDCFDYDVTTKLFSERLVYRYPVQTNINPEAFSQRLNINIFVDSPIDKVYAIESQLSGVSSCKYLTGNKVSFNSGMIKSEYHNNRHNNKWSSNNNVLGFDDKSDIILTLHAKTDRTEKEQYEFDLTEYLQHITQYKITVNLELILGKELKLQSPIQIEEWKDNITDLN